MRRDVGLQFLGPKKAGSPRKTLVLAYALGLVALGLSGTSKANCFRVYHLASQTNWADLANSIFGKSILPDSDPYWGKKILIDASAMGRYSEGHVVDGAVVGDALKVFRGILDRTDLSLSQIAELVSKADADDLLCPQKKMLALQRWKRVLDLPPVPMISPRLPSSPTWKTRPTSNRTSIELEFPE